MYYRPSQSAAVAALLGDSEIDSLESAHSQTDYLGYSPFHPRPLAVSCSNIQMYNSNCP